MSHCMDGSLQCVSNRSSEFLTGGDGLNDDMSADVFNF